MFKKIKYENGKRDIYAFDKKILSYTSTKCYRNYVSQKLKNLSTKNIESLIKYYDDKDELCRIEFLIEKLQIPLHYQNIFFDMYISSDEKICLDCGAHRGWFSDLVFACGGVSYAFEPNVYLAKMLKNKYKNNPNVLYYDKAVGASNYQTEFRIDGGGVLSQGNRIVSNTIDDTQNSYKVEVIDLCEFIQNEIIAKDKKIYFLKLDVEGAEFEIMNKLIEQKLYEHIKYIACETHERFFEDGDEKIYKLKEKIIKHGINNIFLDWI